jgi:hypothetical protein
MPASYQNLKKSRIQADFAIRHRHPREVEPMRFQIAMPENTAPTPLGALTVSPDALRLPSPLFRMAGPLGAVPRFSGSTPVAGHLNRHGNALLVPR